MNNHDYRHLLRHLLANAYHTYAKACRDIGLKGWERMNGVDDIPETMLRPLWLRVQENRRVGWKRRKR